MAPERPRRKPQVFPKSHIPRRFFGFFLIAQKETRPAGRNILKQKRGFAAAAATYFAYSGKVGKTPLGEMAFWKDLRLTPWSFRSHGPRTPVIYEGVR